ncbi:hypothetical protein HNQ69_000147 [Bartonella callosciuri]|uniref:Uncharacterized protein n=1 Tax=Bartonella callosciuri TaxID=686223 RepID=A0A840NST8_9HYPH|nr:hypothetical protein [Bartonella callosciuri]
MTLVNLSYKFYNKEELVSFNFSHEKDNQYILIL